MLKKTILATLTGTVLLASGASFADPYYREGHGYGNRDHGHDYGRREVVVRQFYRPAARPVVVHTYYQPRPVVVERQVVVQRPVPVYSAPVYHSSDAGLAILAGAVLGGAIAYQIANH
jgi:hypothetical protein